jgi:hypothetical protein
MKAQHTLAKLHLTVTTAAFVVVALLSSSLPPSTARAQTSGTGTPRPERRAVFKNPRQEQLPAAQHALAASYYSVGDGLGATLTLNNKGSAALAAQLTLFGLGGESLDLPPVTVEGGSHRVVDLREHAAAGSPFEQGSLHVVYYGRALEMGAQVKLVDAARGLIFDEQLVEPAAMFASPQLETVWWIPSRKSDVRLVLSNTSDSGLAVSAVVDGVTPKLKEASSLTLAPHETRVLRVPQDLTDKRGAALAEAGGVSLRHSGAAGALLARALIQEPQTGYSAVAEFTDPQTAKSSELHGAGLRLGEAGGERLEPVVVARNTRNTETVLGGRLSYALADGSMGHVDLPETRLAAGEARVVHVAGGPGLQPQAVASAGLEFEYSGGPGAVVMSALSRSRSGRQVFRVPLIDPVALPSSTGGYPWYIEGSSSTVVYVKNVTDQPRQFRPFILYDGGTYMPDLKTVEPGQTVTLDVRALRDGQVPDANGQTIPRAATRGQVQWSMTGRENHVLIGRAEQADAARGLSSSYACANCCPNEFFDGWVTPGDIVGYEDDTSQFTAMQRDTNCYGQLYPPRMADVAYYESTDPAVASCTYNGFATAQLPGFTSIVATWTADAWWYWGGGYCEYTPVEVLAEAFCEVLQNPASLSVISVTKLPDSTDPSVHGCVNTSDTGIKVGVKFQVKDRRGEDIQRSDMIPQEKVTDTSFNGTDQGDPVPNWSDIGPSRITGTARFTDAQGQFLDAAYGFCWHSPFDTYKFKQQISILIGSRRFNVRTNNVTVTGTSVGHGTISNGSDIQKNRP